MTAVVHLASYLTLLVAGVVLSAVGAAYLGFFCVLVMAALIWHKQSLSG